MNRSGPFAPLVPRAALGLIALLAIPLQADTGFLKARPIWPAGRSLEKNLQVAFRAVVPIEDPRGVSLRVTASTLYRATVNGRHAGYGPARGPHGFYRIDRWDISPLLEAGKNVVALEVAGYNVNSYYTLDQPSFLEAEVVAGGAAEGGGAAGGGTVLAATGDSGWEASVIGERVQKVQRYSFQRPFSEVWRIRPDHGLWQVDPAAPFEAVACTAGERPLRFLSRGAPYPEFALRSASSEVAAGSIAPLEKTGPLWKDRSLTAIGEKLKGYPEAELATIPSMEMQKLSFRPDPAPAPSPAKTPLALAAMRYRILDLGTNLTGFIGARVNARKPARLVLAFDEVLTGGDVDFKRLGCVNLLSYEIPPGRFSLESFEPYTLRYLKAILLEGECDLEEVSLREYANPNVTKASFRSSDPRLERLFEAGRETFRQNALDAFMDCPSRERAGWLCDSFFTARVAPDLGGDTALEGVMMENFLLPEKFEFLPPGMLPMCYPADHNDGVFIPNWAMWFVIQLEEYLGRSGDRDTVDRLKGRVLALLDSLRKLRNSDGLLERLPGWVFVEWSDANRYVQDVNYPSNMLYAGMLSCVGRIYGIEEASAEAERVRETVRRQSFDGSFFVDNAVRKPGGALEVTRNRTEVCQYFAFFFGVATPESHPALWSTLLEKFGPKRGRENPFPEVGLANSFIGNMLRIELLSRQGLSQQVLDESIDYLLYMADRTGTLWENIGDSASCDHGFASHICHTLIRDILGARELDRVGKRLRVRFAPLALDGCEGTLPTPQGPVSLSWKKRGDRLEYRISVPEGYEVDVENRSGLKLEKAAGPAEAGDWPQWRGPEGTSVSREAGLPFQWDEKTGVLWKTKIPEWGDSTPAIWGDAVFLTSHEEDRLLLLSIAKGTGRIEWTRQVGSGTAKRKTSRDRGEQKFHQTHNLATPSPVTDGERVVVHFGNGDLASYDFKGNREWGRNLQEDHGKYTIWWGHANSPVLHGDLVISVCMQDSLEDLRPDPSPSYLVAHDKRTGKEIWKTPRKTAARSEQCDSYTTPIFHGTPKGAEMIVMGGNQLDAYDPLTGRQLWYLPGLDGNRTITGPTLGLGMAFCTIGMRGPVVAVKLGGEGRLPAESVLWRHEKGGTPDSPSLVLSGDLLFLVSDDGIAQCFDARTGKLHWKERIPGSHRATPLSADGRIYFLNMTGLSTVISASSKFVKLSENQLDDETIASPAVSEGRIYLRGRKWLYCLGPAAPAAGAAGSALSLFDGKTLDGWKVAKESDFELHGDVHVEEATIVLPRGDAQTGIAWTGDFPREDYEVSLEAARLEGTDFFCGLTFPVGESPCTLIVGGWGGTVVGLSNVDGNAAVENMTTSFKPFENGRWYRIRLRVTKTSIEAWIDDEQAIDLERAGHRFTIWSQQEPVLPFGIATWHTKGALRKISLKRL